MKCIKKLVALTLAAVLALAMLTACGGTPAEPPIQPDIEKGKEIAAALNEARVAAGKKEVPFDEEYSVKLTEYANAYTNWQFAMRAYDQNKTAENEAALNAAKQKYDEASKKLPGGISSGRLISVNVARFDAVKESGRNYFIRKDGDYHLLATWEGDMCAVTVITKEDLTFAIILVGTKSTK